MILAANPKFSLEPVEKVVPKIDENFPGWEILAEKRTGWDYRNQLKDVLSTTDLHIQIHAPLNDLNIGSINPRLRKAAIGELERAFEMASMLGAQKVTFHPGFFSPLGRFWDGLHDTVNDSLKRVESLGEEYGVDPLLENMPDLTVTMCHTPGEITSFIEDKDIGFCLDIGHAHTTGNLEDFLKMDPKNVHLNDNEGGKDLHLALGDGEIDFDTVFDGLEGYDGHFVIEGRSFDDLVKSKDYLKEVHNL